MKIRVWLLAFILACVGVAPVRGQQVYTSVDAFSGLVFPNAVALASPPGESNRLFVVEKHGRIAVITNLAAPTRTVFMDISGRVTIADADESTDVNSEEGLLGLAFHPGYATNGFFYVCYTGQATNGTTGLHDILSRFQVLPGDPDHGDANSELRLIAQYDRADNHNGGDLHFGSDGYLYVGLGDEGGANNQFNNAQHLDHNFFSGILRIDVDKRPGNLAPKPNLEFASSTNYAVPADNPFVGFTTFDNVVLDTNHLRTEFWAVGLRNPWRFSFDSATDMLLCGDVGQDEWEEVDVIVKGGNYGWASFEGLTSPPQGVNTNGWPATHNPHQPITLVQHPNGEAIIGGVVYHGSRLPDLDGAYIYGDNVTGFMAWLKTDGISVTSSGGLFGDVGVSAYGIDPSNGDVLYCNLRNGSDSIIKRIVPAATGSVQVTIDPPGAIATGAKWQIGGGPFQDSGTLVTNLPVGNFMLAFKTIPGWTAPSSRLITIASNLTTITNGTYVSTDNAKPTVTIMSPTSNQRVATPLFDAAGTAKDNAAVAEVWYQLNSGSWTLATGTTNWAVANLPLTPGANTLRVYAVDTSGNFSSTNSVGFVYVVSTTLSVLVNGQGQLTPNLDGQLLEIGKSFSMTAKPVKGFDFVSWTGSAASSKAKLTFVMASNLTFTANFADVTRPVNIVTSPKLNQIVSTATIAATGKASDNAGVAAVYYQLNGAGGIASTSDGWTNWTAAGLPLLSGANLIQAWAVDNTGNASRTNSVKFNRTVALTPDWAPDSLSGLAAQAVPDAGTATSIGFDVVAFSQSGAGTNDDFGAGIYTYVKLDTNFAHLNLTNTVPPLATNRTDSVDVIFTNHYAGVFTNQDGDTGTITFSIAPNLVPAALKSVSATSGNGGGVTAVKLGATTFTIAPGASGPSSTGVFSYARYSPNAAMLQLVFGGADAGTVSFVQLTFTAKNAGTYFVVTYNGGVLVDIDGGTFTSK